MIFRRIGWGGRIRTYDTRYQKPMPYHLATPQYFCPGLQVKIYKYPKAERDYSDQVLADQLKNRAVGWKK